MYLLNLNSMIYRIGTNDDSEGRRSVSLKAILLCYTKHILFYMCIQYLTIIILIY